MKLKSNSKKKDQKEKRTYKLMDKSYLPLAYRSIPVLVPCAPDDPDAIKST